MPRAGLDRATIVAAAAAILNTEGAEALTLNRLAQELGVKTPSLYNHIDGLPGLYRELARSNARSLGERFTQAAIGKSGPAALIAVATAYRAYIKESPGVYLASLRSSGTQQPVDAELSAAEEQSVRVGVAVIASFGLAARTHYTPCAACAAWCMALPRWKSPEALACRSVWTRALIGYCRCLCTACRPREARRENDQTD